jgi:hypothetical protein
MAFSATVFDLDKAHMASPAIARMATVKTAVFSLRNNRLFRIIPFHAFHNWIFLRRPGPERDSC